MGLGKTLQSISILAYMRDFQKVWTSETRLPLSVPVQQNHHSRRPGLVGSIFVLIGTTAVDREVGVTAVVRGLGCDGMSRNVER